MSGFESLGVSDWLVKSCREMGISTPTPIQRLSIPKIQKGENISARAKTGSGKTAAFAVPILDRLSRDPYGIFGLILTPARELALQITEQIQVLGAGCQIQVCTIIGGMDMVEQGLRLEDRPHIIVATPGRLADLIRSGNSRLKKACSLLQFIVLDEADRLFQPEFGPDLTTINGILPDKSRRQTLLFSATLEENSVDSIDMPEICSNVKYSFVSSSDTSTSTVEEVDQKYIFMPASAKDCCLLHLMRSEKFSSSSVIIFVGTKRECREISELLTILEIDNVALHSDLSQPRRTAALGKFKSRITRILVATDVASRGLDIPSVDLVVNYDLPVNAKDYVHRIGRTGRAGRFGTSVTLLSQYNVEQLLKLEDELGKKLQEWKVEDDEISELMKEVNPARRMAKIRMEEYRIKERKLASGSRKRKHSGTDEKLASRNKSEVH